MVGVVADSVAEDGFEPDDVVEVEHRPIVLVDVDRFPPVGHDVVGIGVVAPVEPFEDGFDGFAVESHVVLLVRALSCGPGRGRGVRVRSGEGFVQDVHRILQVGHGIPGLDGFEQAQ